MSRIDSAYDYYVSTYETQKVSRYDSHKKSDLRKLSNRILKVNKEAPLYKISNLNAAKKYAIDIKESTKELRNVVSSLSDQYGSFSDSFQKKVAVSSDNDTVEVTYIGDGKEEDQADKFSIYVKELATPQVNTGNFIKDNEHSLAPGTYSFDLTTNTAAYEFQYNVSRDESNLDIIRKLANLVNKSRLGITADVVSDGNGSSALSLTSEQTGLSENEKYLFSISPGTTSGSIEAMDLLGINRVDKQAHNSSFTLNDKPHSSLSNTFSINNAFELTLKKPTGVQGTTIGFKANTDAIADNIQTLLDAYNHVIDTSSSVYGNEADQDGKLHRDMSSLAKKNQVALESIGLMVSDNGSISVDRGILSKAVEPAHAGDSFKILSKFRDIVGEKADSISVDPMNYVNKVVVAYKNPGHNFATPYISSMYSGMLLDSYI